MSRLTSRIVCELASHEGLCTEAYKDSQGIWTWSIGITNASGHQVHPRYLDQEQELKQCLATYEWVLRTRYLPDVLDVFKDHGLTEPQLGAALSFHYNTGAIRKASWAKLWMDGRIDEARAAFMMWSKPPEIIPRRKKERDLFFDGTWSSAGTVNLYRVRKPSYVPDWASAKQVNITAIMDELMA